MKQYEQVIAALESNGGYATFGQLYKLIDFSKWGTQTPHASVRRIVQEQTEIFKIKPGLWALESFRDKLPPHILIHESTSQSEIDVYNHAYYQGLLIELGKMRNFNTFVPAQDQNRLFLKNRLGEIADSVSCPDFTYERIVRRVKTIDVIWFNSRDFPSAVYEVEHSTDFHNSLLKFVELQDFSVEFWIVADEIRKREFDSKISAVAFKPIINRVKFLDYEKLSFWHQKQYELSKIWDNS